MHPHCEDGLKSTDPNQVGYMKVEVHTECTPTVRMGLGRPTQTQWDMTVEVHTECTPAVRMGLGRPTQTRWDMKVEVHTECTPTVRMDLGRPTQTSRIIRRIMRRILLKWLVVTGRVY